MNGLPSATAIVVASCLLVTACGGGADDVPAPRTATTTATVTVTPSTSPESRTSTTPPDAEGQSTPSNSSSSSDAVVPSDAAGRALHLNEFFNPDEAAWEEGRFDVASKAQLMGLAAEVSGCGDSSAAELELRLAHRFKNLSFSAGQATRSKSAQDKVIVEVLTNGSKVESRSIAFDSIQKFDVSVKDVNSATIRAYLDDGVNDCGSHGSSTIVITDAMVK